MMLVVLAADYRPCYIKTICKAVGGIVVLAAVLYY